MKVDAFYLALDELQTKVHVISGFPFFDEDRSCINQIGDPCVAQTMCNSLSVFNIRPANHAQILILPSSQPDLENPLLCIERVPGKNASLLKSARRGNNLHHQEPPSQELGK